MAGMLIAAIDASSTAAPAGVNRALQNRLFMFPAFSCELRSSDNHTVPIGAPVRLPGPGAGYLLR
jgi:hypothetical protein